MNNVSELRYHGLAVRGLKTWALRVSSAHSLPRLTFGASCGNGVNNVWIDCANSD